MTDRVADELGPADEPLLWNGVPLQLRERRAAAAAPAPASDGPPRIRAEFHRGLGRGSEISTLRGLSGRRSTLDMVRTDGCATTSLSPSASLRIGWGASSRDQFPTHPNILQLLRVVPNVEYDCPNDSNTATHRVCRRHFSSSSSRSTAASTASCTTWSRPRSRRASASRANMSASSRPLSHIHKNEVFHRDLKFQNLLLAEDFSLKISDFGLALGRNTPSCRTGCRHCDAALEAQGSERVLRASSAHARALRRRDRLH